MPAKQPPKATTTAAPVRPPIQRRLSPPPEDAHEENEQTGNESMSKEDAFDSASAAALGIPPGDWEARILEMVYEKKEGKGESVKVTYEATEPDDQSPAYGKKSSQWYQIFKKDGTIGAGVGFLKADLEKLGVDAEGQKFANIEATLEQISEAQPLCNVRVKQNGQYLNVYLQGLVVEGE